MIREGYAAVGREVNALWFVLPIAADEFLLLVFFSHGTCLCVEGFNRADGCQ